MLVWHSYKGSNRLMHLGKRMKGGGFPQVMYITDEEDGRKKGKIDKSIGKGNRK